MRLFPTCLALIVFFSLLSCGHKKPPKPFPPPQGKLTQNRTAEGLLKGIGGYFIGDDGFVILYWDLPTKVDHFEVYKDFQLIGKTQNNTFLVKETIKDVTVFRIVGYRGKKPVGKIVIKVTP